MDYKIMLPIAFVLLFIPMVHGANVEYISNNFPVTNGTVNIPSGGAVTTIVNLSIPTPNRVVSHIVMASHESVSATLTLSLNGSVCGQASALLTSMAYYDCTRRSSPDIVDGVVNITIDNSNLVTTVGISMYQIITYEQNTSAADLGNNFTQILNAIAQSNTSILNNLTTVNDTVKSLNFTTDLTPVLTAINDSRTNNTLEHQLTRANFTQQFQAVFGNFTSLFSQLTRFELFTNTTLDQRLQNNFTHIDSHLHNISDQQFNQTNFVLANTTTEIRSLNVTNTTINNNYNISANATDIWNFTFRNNLTAQETLVQDWEFRWCCPNSETFT